MKQTEDFKGFDAFEHVVVLMLENRSFDNLLGYLHNDTHLTQEQFAGLQGTDIKMPVPKRASDYNEHQFVVPSAAENYHQPYPDPGEVYQHVNTQLYNHVDKYNLKVEAKDMKPPYNIPQPQPHIPPMDGFVNDYINTLQAIDCKECKDGEHTQECEACEGYHNPKFAQYKRIMECYTPKQLPVLTTLAKEFAVFDHWYCSVPSQTWCNRAFWHAASSGGKVANPSLSEMPSWAENVYTLETIFERMEKHNVSHNVYTREPIALTTLVNGPFKNENTVYIDKELRGFKRHLKERKLAQYSFVEPKFTGAHNDMHPSAAEPSPVDGPERVGSVLLGDHLIWELYTSIFTDDYYKDNTLFIITFDEHGGCFDHVPPPPPYPENESNKVWPPTAGMTGQDGFKFNRLGIRVPMVMVSSHIPKNTIVTDRYDHTSFIKTVTKKWNLGDSLTDRDNHANTFEGIFSATKRSFPPIDEPPVNEIDESIYENDPLNDLQATILRGAHHWASKKQEEIDPNVKLPSIDNVKTVGEHHAHLEKI